MSCSRTGKGIALHAGADLPARRARRLARHLRRCAECRAELEEHKSVLDAVRLISGRETLDWSEAEWKTLLTQATRQRPEAGRLPSPAPSIRRAWAYGLAALVLLGVAAVIRISLVSPPAAQPLIVVVSLTPAQPARPLESNPIAGSTGLRDVPFKVGRERTRLEQADLPAPPAAALGGQETLSLTLVSQPTGLKVHWTFNRNFDWEEKNDEKSLWNLHPSRCSPLSRRRRFRSGE